MKKLIAVILTILAFSCSTENSKETVTEKQNYQKSDLKKISWIEGNWKGIYEGKPFYELYHFTNDSTLEIISYDWNGQDSSHTSISKLQWIDNTYYLGKEKNYKVTGISDSSIYMRPNFKANNDILWKFSNDNSWKAILKGAQKENNYLMERVQTF